MRRWTGQIDGEITYELGVYAREPFPPTWTTWVVWATAAPADRRAAATAEKRILNVMGNERCNERIRDQAKLAKTK